MESRNRFIAPTQLRECSNVMKTLQNFTRDMCDTTSVEETNSLLWPAYNMVFPGVLAVGMIGNLMNLIVLTRPTLKGVTYVYLTGLALTDLAVMLAVVPAVLRFNRHQSLPYFVAFYHAYIELVLTNTFMATSVLIVCFLTLDRYFSICRPTEFKNIHTKKNAVIAITMSYIMGFMISCPLAGLKSPCIMTTDGKYSYQENRHVTQTAVWVIYLWVCEPAIRIMPAIALAVLNCLIIKSFQKLARHQRKIPDRMHKFRRRLNTTDRQNVVRYRLYLEEQRLVHLLTGIIITFFITMTPATVLSLIYTDHLDNHFGFQIFRAVANILEICNFALNFFIYCLCSKQFRQACVSIFRTAKTVKSDDIVLNSMKNGTSCSQ